MEANVFTPMDLLVVSSSLNFSHPAASNLCSSSLVTRKNWNLVLGNLQLASSWQQSVWTERVGYGHLTDPLVGTKLLGPKFMAMRCVQ